MSQLKTNKFLSLGRRLKLCRLMSTVPKPKLTEKHKTRLLTLENYNLGSKVHGFTVQQKQEIPELLLTVVRLTHDKTGADYIHVARDDKNNVFNIGFRTTPMDSTGVSHILEHTVLCGSHTYPCRDPFFKMANRSLATYMNALTGLDYTMYPFATQNAKDFRNLMSVYLDAVFAPYLRELDFRQEGWRLENEDLDDSKSPLVFRGIVFNEMKGAFANSDQLFSQKLINNLLPSHTYAHVSGGEPMKILDLTWDHLRKFHKTHYHPSNARIYTYGNFPLENHLEFINDKLNKFSRTKIDTNIPLESRWDKPKTVEITCRSDPLLPNSEKNATVSVSYLLGSTADAQETSTLQILSFLLISEPNSPFYKSLLQPNIGANYSPFTGFDHQTREGMFSIGLQGIQPSDVNKVCDIISKTFDDVIKNGFEANEIEAVLHKIELDNKLVTVNYGLHLSMFLMPFWNHEANVVDVLKINEIIKRFRQDLKDNPKFLQEKVEKYFKKNNHKLTLIMKPDVNYERKMIEEEKNKLSNMTSTLKDDDKKKIFELGQELRAKQEREEDISCLPTLKISDIDAKMKITPLEHRRIENKEVQLCIQPTNGVTHFRSFFSTRSIPENLQSYIPLFCLVATKLGAGNLDYNKLSQKIDMKTGGLDVFAHVAENAARLDAYEEGIVLYSHCLDRNIPDMFDLWSLIFDSIKFDDTTRLSTLIQMEANHLISSISDVGSMHALNQAASVLTEAAAIKNRYNGMQHVTSMRNLAEKTNLNEVIQILKKIASIVFADPECRFAVNTTPDCVNQVNLGLEGLLKNLKSTGKISNENKIIRQSLKTKCHYVLPFPVNYIGKGILGVPFGHNDFASLSVAAELMTNKFLHREIREKGGAYGGGAGFHSNGIFSFYSYRDPNTTRTMEKFDEAIVWAGKGNFSQQDIDEAKLAVFQHIDKPISPGDKGSRYFLNRISDELYQLNRERLSAVTKDDLIRVTSNYLSTSKMSGACVLGPDNNEIKNDPKWLIINNYKNM